MKEKTYEQMLDEMISDKIHNPSHYQGAFGLEAIEVVRNFAGDLTAVEDLKKARKNLDWLIEELEVEKR